MSDILTELRLDALEQGKPVDLLALLERTRNLLANTTYFTQVHLYNTEYHQAPEVKTVRTLLDYAIAQMQKGTDAS